MQLKINNYWQKRALLEEVMTYLNIVEEYDRKKYKDLHEKEPDNLNLQCDTMHDLHMNKIVKNMIDLMIGTPFELEEEEKREARD